MINKDNLVLITGCGGMLGEAVYKEFQEKCKIFATDIDLNESWLKYLDVSDDEQVSKLGREIRPDFIVHLAALTDMEYCELHSDEAYLTNANGTKNVVNLARERGIPLVYISTAGIFDGKKEQYDENDEPVPPAPLSVYGKSKYAGELTAKEWDKSIIIRAGWMMGGGPKKDKKFINKIIKQLLGGAKELNVVNDKFGTPTYTYDLAKIIVYLLEHERYGRYHGVCDGGGSRYEIAVCVLDSLGLGKKVGIRVVNSDYFKDSFFAPRPASEQMSNQRLKKLNYGLTRDWRECLNEYLAKFDWRTDSNGTRIL